MRTEHATPAVPGSRSRPLGGPHPLAGDPLDSLVEHLRRHPRIDGGAFMVIDQGRLWPVASWFGSPEASARELWDAYAGAAVIACPARDPGGRVIGALEAVCFDADRPFASEHLQTVELMADMAALAYERSVRSRLEAAQARVEGQLEQARGDVSGSLETGEVASRAP